MMISYNGLLEKFKELLKNNALKFTKQRELILKFLYQNKGHYTPEDIYMLLKQQHPDVNIGIATVYRTLTLLEESHIVSSISFGIQGKKYELGLKKHHDHLICTQCGKIIEFYDEIIEERQEEIAKKFNFKMTGHTMKIEGICEACQKAESEA
ncbi:transcriptional repressor [Sulfurovum sp.]|jgi:Fur family ferric uptake transcriptional regulator|uniref:Fur family transcriptional regulator n=1 Tax=Sulfurovum sp. TaxID=1969726 RepID=UPI002A3606F2|nr:transcriptional repressor [Sulfurovum sp.]MDD2451274.1 transcriptional repressor [Sulfurovum sp.]MDD3499574.1 transcriptional repressor [Sulfurovum sp.]MDY0403223.1 transcriptional repressor [Sulfurovum sp.]